MLSLTALIRFLTSVWAVVLLVGCPGNKDATTQGKPPGMPPVPVNTALVVRKDMPLDLRTFGNIEPIASVAIKAQVGGELIKVSFKEGDDVKKGELLFTIQPRLFETQLAQAEANLARDRAQAANARRELARQEQLDAKGSGVQEALDKARTQVETADAVVKADEALVLIAQTQVGYTTIESPLDGRTGAIRLREGNLIKVGDDLPLTTVVQLSPIYVSFALPEQHLADIRRGMEARTLPVIARDPKDGHTLGEGALAFIANTVDAATGTVTLKASFPNVGTTLWPGAFVDVVLRLDTQRDAIVVPSPAVTSGQRGTQIFVVKADSTVETRNVTVVRTVGQESILSGSVEAGEKIIINGQSRVVPGAKVIEKAAANPEKTTSQSGSVKMLCWKKLA
jgi:multidrug efflux system membrane fusion protein